MNRCAIYARYSSDKQSPCSIQDQIRKCTEYAAAQNWTVLPEHIYCDEAMSGSGTDRPAFTQLKTAALQQKPRPFDILLVDDSSRLSRHQPTAMSLLEQLKFAEVRYVCVSQGIDSHSEQAEVMLTVHGLIDSQYVKELGKKTHRGLQGRVISGLHAGGRCYGYQNVQCDGGVRLEVNEAEAQVVRRIFEMSAGGLSLKTIAKALNKERIPSPRPRPGNPQSWSPTALRAMLRNERYAGQEIWNRGHFVKAPGTNKRIRRERPKSEWIVTDRPELRIVSADLWKRVHARQTFLKERYKIEKPALSRNLAEGAI
jgi:DNA invertase Pin-like site-specific DNA recombinase